MKKFLMMFAIAGALVACNNSGEGTDTAEDSARIQDSIQRAQDSINAMTPPAGDTTNMGDTTGASGMTPQ